MTKFDRRTVLFTGGLALGHRSLAMAGAGAGVETMRAARGDQPGGNGSAEPTAPSQYETAADGILPSFPSTDPQVAGAVVGAAHSDLDRVSELVSARPHLARATVDWGFGDWESALGAAAHVGRRDIAEFLLAHGARPTIFSAAMLGQLEVVTAMVEASPGVQRIPGPHGITLLSHARAGGDAAAAVHDYLEGLGDADGGPEVVELSEAQRAAFVGTYAFDAAENASFEVSDDRGALWLRRDGRPFGRRLFPVSEHEFYPSGSPSVRIAFEIGNEQGTRLRIIDDVVVLEAARRA